MNEKMKTASIVVIPLHGRTLWSLAAEAICNACIASKVGGLPEIEDTEY